MRTPCAGRFARFLLASICMGSVLSLAMAMLSARDLSRCPSMPGSGIIGGRGYTEDALDRIWRTLAPRSWRAWDDGSGFDWPTRGLAHEIGIIVHPALSEGWKTGEPGHALTGDGWIATVVVGGGFYDLAWVARLDEVRRKGAGDPNLNALEPWEVSKRLEAGETLVTDAPWWIPSDLPRECEGILPGRSGRVGRHFRMVDVPEDAWMQEMVWSAEADRLRLGGNHVVGTLRVDEVRVFGWPFRAFAVRGAMVENVVYEDNSEHGLDEVSIVVNWWTDGLGVDASHGREIGHPLSQEIESLPAKGLPWRPMWLPLLGNALVLGVPLVMLFLGTKTGVRLAIARLRGGADRCGNCGYARQGHSEDARCPECGELPTRA